MSNENVGNLDKEDPGKGRDLSAGSWRWEAARVVDAPLLDRRNHKALQKTQLDASPEEVVEEEDSTCSFPKTLPVGSREAPASCLDRDCVKHCGDMKEVSVDHPHSPLDYGKYFSLPETIV